MSKDTRKVGRLIRKLKKAKTSAETIRILQEVKREDPETYARLQNLKGN